MRRSLWAAALYLLLLLTACGAHSPQEEISRALGLDIQRGQVVSQWDSHGGFNGDGTTCIQLHFQDDSVLRQIQESEEWQKFPPDRTVQILAYGWQEETDGWVFSAGPYLTDGDGNPLVPEIQEGYYRLIDRHVEAEGAAETDILRRASYNFTLGLYDSAANTLYFCMLGT